jgi:hypothetical protein
MSPAATHHGAVLLLVFSVAFFSLYHTMITVSDGCKYVARTMIVLQGKKITNDTLYVHVVCFSEGNTPSNNGKSQVSTKTASV